MSEYFAVVMAGGSGTRFWPMSRSHLPKQLLPLLGPRTMIRQTVDRLLPTFTNKRVFVLCGRLHRKLTEESVEMLSAEQIIDEPVGRDTAAAVGLAATFLEWRSPGSTFCALPADAYIGDLDRFEKALKAGFDAAQDGSLVTFGVPPTRPSTAYGYLQRGAKTGTTFEVKKFCEKPDAATARIFAGSGEHFWNSGIFIWRTDALLERFRKHLPEHAARLQTIGKALGTSDLPKVLNREFPLIPKISVDYGIMEKDDRVRMIEAAFEWDDVGSWSAVLDRRERDADGNVVEAKSARVDTSNTVIVSSEPDHLIATLGLENYIVVHTKDATLICPRGRSEDLKKLIDRIRAEGGETYL